MSNQLNNELKNDLPAGKAGFQLERMILFSDAVFAIAITLLVIEIKIPEVHDEPVSDALLLTALKDLIPKFVGFFISFIFIGLYWTIHHRMFGFVTNYDRKLLFLNLLFLFFIALMPFSTGFYSEYAGKLFRYQLTVPLTFYVLNFCSIGFVNYFMWRYISNPKHKLTEPPIDPSILKFAKARALIVPVVFLLMLPVAYLFNIMIAVYMPMLIPIIIRIFKWALTRKNKIVQTA